MMSSGDYIQLINHRTVKNCIIHCSTFSNKRTNVCAFLFENPSRVSFGKMSKFCSLRSTSPCF